MPQLTSKQFARLESLVIGLQDFLDSVRSEGAEVTPEVAARIELFKAESRCLYCEKPLKGKTTRGDHAACYSLLMQRVRRGEETFAGLVVHGWINPTIDKPGRRADRPDPMRGRPAPAEKQTDDQRAKDTFRELKRNATPPKPRAKKPQ